MDDLLALQAVIAEFGLGISLSTVGHDWKLILIGPEGPIAGAAHANLGYLCRAAIEWVREDYAVTQAPRV